MIKEMRLIIQRSLIAIACVALATPAIYAWYKTAASYSKNQIQLNKELGPIYNVQSVPNETIETIELSWVRGFHDSLEFSNGLKTLAMKPTIESVMELINFRMPRFLWTNPRENEKHSRIALVQTMLWPPSVDRTIYRCVGCRKVLVYSAKTAAIIYSETESGIQESHYFQPR